LWAQLKRGINGTYIHVSGKHLPKYLGEFEYRWNMRAVPHLMLDRLHAFNTIAYQAVVKGGGPWTSDAFGTVHRTGQGDNLGVEVRKTTVT
jgi:hypothetical protein